MIKLLKLGVVLIICIVEVYFVFLSGVAMFIFGARESSSHIAFLLVPFLSIPILMMWSKRHVLGEVLFWCFAFGYHLLLASISWPLVIPAFFTNFRVDVPALTIALLLTCYRVWFGDTTRRNEKAAAL